MSDHLTGVANRRAFFEAAEVELKRWRRAPRPLALITLDADHFKQINDTYGHPAGDAVLRDLAGALNEAVREMDIVARIGGEEFAILLPSADLSTAESIAERIRREVADRMVEWEGCKIHYTVSIGVSMMHDGMTGMDSMLRHADAAMYAAKRNGRNRVEVAAQIIG
jgi:diguanylate cyclase (GGDEF)-like protein